MAVAQSVIATATTKSDTDAKHTLTVNTKDDGFFTVQYDITKKFTPIVEGKGSLKLGTKADFAQWDAINNTGSGKVDFYLSANALLQLKKGGAFDDKYEGGLCRSKGNSTGRVLLGAMPLGKAIATIPGGQVVNLVTNISVPVCLVANAQTSMSYDVINLSGKLTSSITLGNKQSPQIANTQSLTVAVPPSTATLGNDATVLSISGKKTFQVEAKAEVGIEFGVEISDKASLGVVGASVAVVGKPSLTGTFGGELISKNFSSLDSEATACLELKAEADIRSVAFLDSLFNKSPLTLVGTVPIMQPKTKKWGLCKGDYIKISATGQALHGSATEWSCVLDTQTGLMWEKKTNDGGLRDADHGYSWFEDDSGYADPRDYYTQNGTTEPSYYARPYGHYCDNTLAKCNTKAYANAVNAQTLCGYSNWRLPNKAELVAIGTKQDKIAYFERSVLDRYWSSSTEADNAFNGAWLVFFDSGDNSYGSKGYYGYVRLVRSSQ